MAGSEVQEKRDVGGANVRDSHQHHFEERAVFVGCGVRAMGTNECVSTS